MKKEFLVFIICCLLICCLGCHEAKQKQINEINLNKLKENKTYNLLDFYKNNKTLFQAKYGRYYSLINQDGDVLIEKYDSTSDVYNEIQQISSNILSENPLKDSGLTQIVINDKIGFVDQNGKIIVHPKYDLPEIYDEVYHSDFFKFNEGMIGVKYNNKRGFIDKTGKEVIPCKYDFAEPFSDGVTVVVKKGNWFIINKKGKEIRLSSKYSRVSPFVNGIAEVISNCGMSHGHTIEYKEPSKYGYIDKKGNEIIPLIYDYQCYGDYTIGDFPFSEGRTVVIINDKFGFINKDGNQMTQIKFQDAKSFKEGLAAVELDYKWGYIDHSGVEIIKPKYVLANDFSEGLADVLFDNGSVRKWGFINKQGEIVIPFLYDEVESFKNGIAKVVLNGKCGLMDLKGKEIILIKYDDITQIK